MNKIEKYKIGSTEVILEDISENVGKIIISNYNLAFSYCWGSMGSDLKSFLLRIDKYYFSNKLIGYNNDKKFCAKQTVKNIRKYIKTEMNYDLPWYKFKEAQKSLREELRNIERYCENENQFVDWMCNIHNKIDMLDLTYKESNEFEELIKSTLGCEPWHFISYSPSENVLFLQKLFPKLQNEIKKKY